MGSLIKYLVQVQCQPVQTGAEAQIIDAVGRCFNVTGCASHPSGFVVEVVSNHSLAYAALKDLADLVEQAISASGASLTSGVISRVDRNPLSVLSRIFGPWGPIADRCFGWTRLVTLMFFQQNLNFDLFLNAKAVQFQQVGPARG